LSISNTKILKKNHHSSLYNDSPLVSLVLRQDHDTHVLCANTWPFFGAMCVCCLVTYPAPCYPRLVIVQSASPVLVISVSLVFAALCWFIVILTCVLPYFVEPYEYPVKSII